MDEAGRRMQAHEAGAARAAGRACPRCGGTLRPWIADRVTLVRRPAPGGRVPHDHLLRCEQCGYETLERVHAE